MRVNDNYREGVNVEDEEKDTNSVLHFWRKAIATRRAHSSLLARGHFEELDHENEGTFSYLKRDGDQVAYVIANYTLHPQPVQIPKALQSRKLELVLTNGSGADSDTLGPLEGRVYITKD